MIEALEFWNEPNNLSHWNHRLDPEWQAFSAMLVDAASASRELAPGLTRVLGGICPIDPAFIARLECSGALDLIDAVGIHGFPIDWDCWPIDEWPDRIREIRAVTDRPLWATEVGTSSMGAEFVQAFGLSRTLELLPPHVERLFWYSLLDLPLDWPPTIAAHEPDYGSNYRRHFHMGLVRADGRPKPAAALFDPARLGICQWFHWHDRRLDEAVRWLRALQIRRVRTCISWADWHRPGNHAWFDLMMSRLAEFELTLILCFTPPSRGVQAEASSPPRDIREFGWFTREIIERYYLRPMGRPSRLEAPPSVSPVPQ
jgi:beta-xylosidase